MERKVKLRQWIRVVLFRHGNYAVIYTDEFGQVVAFDTHGPLIESRLAPPAGRELRLNDITSARRRSLSLQGFPMELRPNDIIHRQALERDRVG